MSQLSIYKEYIDNYVDLEKVNLENYNYCIKLNSARVEAGHDKIVIIDNTLDYVIKFYIDSLKGDENEIIKKNEEIEKFNLSNHIIKEIYLGKFNNHNVVIQLKVAPVFNLNYNANEFKKGLNLDEISNLNNFLKAINLQKLDCHFSNIGILNNKIVIIDI